MDAHGDHRGRHDRGGLAADAARPRALICPHARVSGDRGVFRGGFVAEDRSPASDGAARYPPADLSQHHVSATAVRHAVYTVRPISHSGGCSVILDVMFIRSSAVLF